MDASAYDLRVVAIHECAHQIVAEHHGVGAKVLIRPNQDAQVADRSYIGSVQLVLPLTARVGRHIGLAGVVAECRDQDPQVTALEIADYLEHGDIELSDSDAMFANGYTDGDIKDCLAIIEHLWVKITAAAEDQIATIAVVRRS